MGNTPPWSSSNGEMPATLKDLEVVFSRIVVTAVELALVVFFIMLVYGGFKYLTSRGDAKGTEAGQKTITNALLGLVLLIGIWLILQFIKVFTGVDVTTFTIGQ
jgi:TRAP-type C4-dicarboxylate transport system permease small subunit